MDDNRTIDFIEFFSGLDKLRIKMSEQDALNWQEVALDVLRVKEVSLQVVKAADANSRIISGNPVFLPLDEDRMGSIAEE